MRCKACDQAIQSPIKVEDKFTGIQHEEWICGRCNRLSFSADPPDGYDYVIERIVMDGYVTMDETGECFHEGDE